MHPEIYWLDENIKEGEQPKIKTFESPLDKKNVIGCINRLKNYFSVDSKNADDTTYFDPDFFQNIIARVGIGIRMSWVENLWKINCRGRGDLYSGLESINIEAQGTEYFTQKWVI